MAEKGNWDVGHYGGFPFNEMIYEDKKRKAVDTSGFKYRKKVPSYIQIPFYPDKNDEKK